MIILYAFIDEKKHSYLLSKYANICSKSFYSKVLRYRQWQDAQLSILGRVLLKKGLDQYFGIQDMNIAYMSNRKPFLLNQDLHFNISHGENLVVCCICNFAIGIDVEYVNYMTNYMAFKSQMTKNEYQHIHHSEDKIKAFFKYWTAKEAVVKTLGHGLSVPLQSFEIADDQTELECEKFYLKEICIHGDYQCYVSANNNLSGVSVLIQQIELGIL